MAQQGVCRDVLIHRAEGRVLLGRTSGAADARLEVDNHRVGFDQSGSEQRCEGKHRRSGVAPRGRDEFGTTDLVTKQFRQPVDELVEQTWAGVFGLVPLGVQVLVAEPEVGSEVDDVADLASDLGDDAHGDPMRQTDEYEV